MKLNSSNDKRTSTLAQRNCAGPAAGQSDRHRVGNTVDLAFRMAIAPATVVVVMVTLAVPRDSDANELSEPSPETVPMQLAPRAVAAQPLQSAEPTLMAQAEEHYQVGRYAQAIERFGMIAAMNNHPFAWLRIGNVWHRRGNVAMAMDAYHRARLAAAISPKHQKLWARAMMNMTFLGLDQAKQSLQAIGPVQNRGASVAWTNEVRLRLEELQRVLPPVKAASGYSVQTPDSDNAAPLVGASSSVRR